MKKLIGWCLLASLFVAILGVSIVLLGWYTLAVIAIVTGIMLVCFIGTKLLED